MLIVVGGCAMNSTTRDTDISGRVVDDIAALEIAREAVATNDRWGDKVQFDTPMRFADGSWTVVAWRIPMTSGANRVITIDSSGVVTQYFRGR